jgi:hypothetical protein
MVEIHTHVAAAPHLWVKETIKNNTETEGQREIYTHTTHIKYTKALESFVYSRHSSSREMETWVTIQKMDGSNLGSTAAAAELKTIGK